MKTRIKCVETTVNGVTSKRYTAQVFCLWHNMVSYIWCPAIEMLENIDRNVFWADHEERTAMFGGFEHGSRERAQALIDRLWRSYNHTNASKIERKARDRLEKDRRRQEKRTKVITYEGYPDE